MSKIVHGFDVEGRGRSIGDRPNAINGVGYEDEMLLVVQDFGTRSPVPGRSIYLSRGEVERVVLEMSTWLVLTGGDGAPMFGEVSKGDPVDER